MSKAPLQNFTVGHFKASECNKQPANDQEHKDEVDCATPIETERHPIESQQPGDDDGNHQIRRE